MQYQSRRKRPRSLNLARIKKCQKERWHYFSISRGLCFLTFFDTSKTERAKTFPSFSDKPHDIVWLYHVGKGQGETGITIPLQTTRMAVKMTMCVPVTYPPYTWDKMPALCRADNCCPCFPTYPFDRCDGGFSKPRLANFVLHSCHSSPYKHEQKCLMPKCMLTSTFTPFKVGAKFIFKNVYLGYDDIKYWKQYCTV